MIGFLKAKGGNVALSTALVLPALVGGVGLAVDYGTLTSARSELQQAADAAVLAAGRAWRTKSKPTEVYDGVLRANAAGMSVAAAHLDINEGLNFVELTGTATADVNLFFLHQIGQKTVSVTASAAQSTNDIAISLVLDNTGSMGQGGINALKRASNALIDAVQSNSAGRSDIHMSLVPFVTAVNIKGEGFNDAWIDKTGQSLYNGWSFLNDKLRTNRKNGERLVNLPDDFLGLINDLGQACKNQGNGAPAEEKRALCEKAAAAKAYPHAAKLFELSGTTWKGCVEARPAPYNLDVTPPSAANPNTLFVPYFAPDEPGLASNEYTSSNGNSDTAFNNSWLDDLVSVTDKTTLVGSTLKYFQPSTKFTRETNGITRGPNRACPTPVVPLTTDLTKVRAGVDSMQFWNGSGTNIAEGLAWGWRLLTPNAPFPAPSTMKSSDVSKYLVLMTDGRNVAYGGNNEFTKSDFSSYGFLSQARIGGATTRGTAEAKQNEWTLKLCADVKAQGVEIFTVVYNETATSVRNMFSQCATRTSNFHMASDTTALQAAFAKIGADISVLRLTH